MAWPCVPGRYKLEPCSTVEDMGGEGVVIVEPSSLARSSHSLLGLTDTSSDAGVEKPFRCPKCGMAYAHQGSLVRHRHKCEGTLVLTCSFCKHKFHRKDKLREHLLNKHNYVDEVLGPPGYTLLDHHTGTTAQTAPSLERFGPS